MAPGKALLKRHPIRHQKLSRAAAAASPKLTAQTPTSASTVPVLGGAWQAIGPQPVASVGTPEGEVAGRVTAIAVDPSNSATVYVGTADGGVWKTTNGTSSSPTWAPLFDTQTTLAIGAIAIDPNKTSTIYVGTGEANDCQDCLPSQGVFKSTDGGASWALLANSPVHRTMAIVVDRSNSSRVLVATTRGLWVSGDGGATWAQNTQIATVTYPFTQGGTANGGMDALIQDPVNTSVFWAAMGDWCNTEGGSVVKSTDSGTTWAESTHFPSITPPATRIALALGKDSNNHVHAYAALASCQWSNPAEGDGQLLGIGVNANADGTGNWTVIQPSSTLPDFFAEPPPVAYQGWYDISAAVDPTNPNQAVFGGVTLLITTDGGSTFTDIARPYSSDASNPPLLHPDMHAVVFTGANSFYVGNDGGIWYTENAGATGTTYTNLNHTLGIAQLYTGSSPSNTYLIGGSQDNGTLGLVPGGPTQPTWKQLLDGDGGWTAIDPTTGSKVVWAEQSNLDLFKGSYDATSGSGWAETGPCGSNPCKENTDFIAPFLMDPTNPSILYAGSTFAYRTSDAGGHWTPSPDLTYSSTHSTDGLHSMAEATVSGSTTLLTGSNFGRAMLITSANTTTAWMSASAWIDITGSGTTRLPAYDSTKDSGNSWISGLAVNPSNPSEAWAAIGIDSGARVFHTTNAGAGGGTVWSDITGTGAAAVPNVVIDSITVDPQHPSTVFIGTDAGAMVCGTCGGGAAIGSWAPLGAGLPNVRVDAITPTSDDATIVAWTHGRGVWTLSSAPHAALKPASLGFGNQAVGTTSLAQTITLTNQGTMPLVVSSVAVSGDYSQTNNCATVLPGASCSINVTFTPTALGTRGGTLTVNDNAADSPQTASLSGTGTAPPNPYGILSPSSLTFGNQEVGTTSGAQTITLTNGGSASMTITDISTTGNFAQTNNCIGSLATGSSCKINVTFSPPTTGSQSGTLTVTDNGSNSPQTASLSGTGTQPVVSLSPTSVAFPAQDVNTTSGSQAVTLANTGNQALSISGISVSGDFGQTNNCGGSVPAGGHCTIAVSFTPTNAGARSGALTISDNAPGSPQAAALSGQGIVHFYFAEGYTGPGFTESLSMLSPKHDANVTIDYYTPSGHSSKTMMLAAGHVTLEAVNADVPAGPVSVRVTMDEPGVVERTVHFSSGGWYGSTDKVGVTQPQQEWDFAEGSTLSAFSEYLSLENPNPSDVPISLNYETNTGATATKTVTLPANTRTTVEVFNGSLSSSCSIVSGTAVGCGVGRPFQGVSVQVVSQGLPIIAERPFYVNGYSFGSGPIRDGHDAFGANGRQMEWNFAEGTTEPGFNEYLTLQNTDPSNPSLVDLNYFNQAGIEVTKTVTLPKDTRTTIEVFTGSFTTGTCSVVNGIGVNCGVGPGIVGVSVQVVVHSGSPPIVAERPMYMVYGVQNGGGTVAGAHDVVGATQLAQNFGFAWASTLSGDDDYLTIGNPTASSATLTIIYYGPNGQVGNAYTVSVGAHVRQTIQLWMPPAAGGVGPGQGQVGIIISASQPVQVEKPTYSSNSATYGATDSSGYSPGGF